MNSREQNIKNGATAFAIILAVVIIALICVGTFSLVSLFTPSPEGDNNAKDFYKKYTDSSPKTIIVENSTGQFTLKSGSSFEVSAGNMLNDFSCEFEDDTLTIKNTNKNSFHFSKPNSSITIIIPEDVVLDCLQLNIDAGTCIIKDIATDNFNMETGAGNATLTNVTANEITFEAGAGNIEFFESNLNDFELNCGVGKFTVSDSILTGKCTIECGVGDFSLDLNGNIDDYEISLSAGIGKIKLNGTTYSEVDKMNKGASNSLDIEGGIGSVTINIK